MLSLSIVLEGGQTTSTTQRRRERRRPAGPPESPKRLGETARHTQEDTAVIDERRARVHMLLLRWYDSNRRDLPWRRTGDPYAILVSEVMLQQTQVDRVIPKYEEFLTRFPTILALAEAPLADVIRAWAPLGYNRRAVNLQRLARAVVEQHGGVLPHETSTLRSLPGVGAYTAAAIACFAFRDPQAVVDTNVRRVLTRLDGAASISPGALGALAAAYLSSERPSDWNQALMDLGASICRSASPTCLLCPVRSVCRSAGSVVREKRATYRASRPERFEGSNRHLRGRIVDALRRVVSASPAELAGRLDLENESGATRLRNILAALERDGLVELDAEGRVRLPE